MHEQRLGLAEAGQIRQEPAEGRLKDNALAGVLLNQEKSPGGQRSQRIEGFRVVLVLLQDATLFETVFDEPAAEAIVREFRPGSDDLLDHAVDAGIRRLRGGGEEPEREQVGVERRPGVQVAVGDGLRESSNSSPTRTSSHSQETQSGGRRAA